MRTVAEGRVRRRPCAITQCGLMQWQQVRHSRVNMLVRNRTRIFCGACTARCSELLGRREEPRRCRGECWSGPRVHADAVDREAGSEGGFSTLLSKAHPELVGDWEVLVVDRRLALLARAARHSIPGPERIAGSSRYYAAAWDRTLDLLARGMRYGRSRSPVNTPSALSRHSRSRSRRSRERVSALKPEHARCLQLERSPSKPVTPRCR